MPIPWLKALNKHNMTHIMYIEIENVTHSLTKVNTQSQTTSAACQEKSRRKKEPHAAAVSPNSYSHICIIIKWTTGSLTCIWDLFARVRVKAINQNLLESEIKTVISSGRNQNCDMYWHDLKSYRQRSQFWYLPGRNPSFNFSNPTRFWFVVYIVPWHNTQRGPQFMVPGKELLQSLHEVNSNLREGAKSATQGPPSMQWPHLITSYTDLFTLKYRYGYPCKIVAILNKS